MFLNSIRWWIATLVAIFALIVSGISLGWQIYTYKQEASQLKNPDKYNDAIESPIDISETQSVKEVA